MRITHFDLDRLRWIRIFAMSSGLFYKLASMYQDQSLCCIRCWCLNAINELCEDDLSINEYLQGSLVLVIYCFAAAYENCRSQHRPLKEDLDFWDMSTRKVGYFLLFVFYSLFFFFVSFFLSLQEARNRPRFYYFKISNRVTILHNPVSLRGGINPQNLRSKATASSRWSRYRDRW